MDKTMMDGIREAQGMIVQGRGKPSEERIDAGIGREGTRRMSLTTQERACIAVALKRYIRFCWNGRHSYRDRFALRASISALRI